MDELETQLQNELSRITEVLETSLGRPSRWNGEVEVLDDVSVYGRARWNGRIAINHQIAQNDLRWRTEIHEALHLFSVGLTPQDYLDFQGWEEGVVEQLQRLFRPHILHSLHVAIPEEVFAAEEATHEYNRFILALEKLRGIVNEPIMPFYMTLLAAPLVSRSSLVIQAGRQLPANQFRGFQRDFALAFSVLRGD